MKLVSKHSNFKGFFKSLLIGFIILLIYFDIEIILKNKYETTGHWSYIILALLISVWFWNFSYF